MSHDRHARRHDLTQVRRVKVGNGKPRDLARPTQSIELHSGFNVPRDTEVPPMKLYHVELLDTQPLQRTIDDPLDIPTIDGTEVGQVGHKLRVHLQLPRQIWIRA